MDKKILRIFLRETERQCMFTIMAFQDLEKALPSHDKDRIWYSIQSFLVSAGNVSKLLWPPNAKIPDRAEQLRNSLGVNYNSPLEPRKFRNHFEHFDERLEGWAASSKRKNFVDANVYCSGGISGIEPEDYLRNFDTTNYALTFRGDKYKLKPIIDEIMVLKRKSANEANKAP
ncbi:hypothetical protein CEE37_00445 [candidate division LCP-89 bacterium B3_LCP]|uniref:Uncharacterized protein n=1 Tax=candidate division LCP-89 bacterium B3_LCP TaxID=2012998 RepID=A0A532V4P7_UNCL8|nr:MAG: hypothetical protein CEE37_00445 [candidate division LCP-89 bacterium B3_LCP]